jgi:hypothetical protein
MEMVDIIFSRALMGLILVEVFADQQQWSMPFPCSSPSSQLTTSLRLPKRKKRLPRHRKNPPSLPLHPRRPRPRLRSKRSLVLVPPPKLRRRTSHLARSISMGLHQHIRLRKLDFRRCFLVLDALPGKHLVLGRYFGWQVS